MFQNKKFLFFLLTSITGIILFYPLLDLQPGLAQGDHGRDLYCFKLVLDGGIPYRDYWWPYGPLMPYYFAIFFKFFGIGIKSVLLGQHLLTFGTGLIFYSLLTLFTTPFLSFLGAYLFWSSPSFFHTYNHVGPVLLFAFILYLLALYIRTPKRDYVLFSILCLILLNFAYMPIGIPILAGFITSLYLINLVNRERDGYQKPLWFYVYVIMSVVIFTSLIYLPYVYGLSSLVLYQCFPFLKAQIPLTLSNIPLTLGHVINMLGFHIKHSNLVKIVSILYIFAVVYMCIQYFYKKSRSVFTREQLLFLSTLFIFAVFTLPPYVLSGVPYRLFWPLPLMIPFVVILLDILYKNFSKYIKIIVAIVIIALMSSDVGRYYNIIASIKRPANFLSGPRANVYLGNRPEWMQTVRHATQFIEKNTSKDEKIFPLPYDQIYLFLTERDSGISQNCIFEFNKISDQQQRDMITVLEKENIKWILMSNRIATTETGLGYFGQTHCLILSDYIKTHYKEYIRIGDWQHNPGWIDFHGVAFLKRNDS